MTPAKKICNQLGLSSKAGLGLRVNQLAKITADAQNPNLLYLTSADDVETSLVVEALSASIQPLENRLSFAPGW